MNESTVVPSASELQSAYKAIKGAKVPSIPDILLKLNEEFAKPEPDNNAIVELVLQEQTLTGNIIKTVNSAAYGLQQTVESIPHAVSLLGLKKLKNLVLSALVMQHMNARTPVARQIWEDSLEVAKAALVISNSVDGLAPDEAYLAALLQDCGAMLMAEKWPDYERVWRNSGAQPISIMQMENHRYGANHAVVGYLFGRHWKLPERINQAIYAHHSASCGHIEDASLRALVATLKLANCLVNGRYLDDASALMERVQYLARARAELMMDRAEYEMLARDAATGF